ncbi:hypothetical protein D3C71_1781890 [compost metagenome]
MAVVAGMRAPGIISLVSAIISSVVSSEPAGSSLSGVPSCGIKGPMPIMSGSSSCKYSRSSAKSSRL